MPLPPQVDVLPLPFGSVLPDRLRPMLPLPALEPFDSPAHCFEVAWDGVRALAFVERSGLRLSGRALRDLTPAYPEIQVLQRLVPQDTILDGDLIVPDAEGRPDASALQEREHADDAWGLNAALRRHPVTYVVFDLLYLRGESLLNEPLQHRKALLAEALVSSDRVYVPQAVTGEGVALFDAAREKGLGGILAKRLDGKYHPGRRHPDWLLIQAVRRDDFVVSGFVPGRSSRLLEALIVASYDGQRFQPVGRVVGGFDAQAALRLRRQLDRLPSASPLAGHPWAQAEICWVEPRVVVCVKFSEWDANGLLRFPIFCGLRAEVTPQECVRTPMVDPLKPRGPRTTIELPRLPL